MLKLRKDRLVLGSVLRIDSIGPFFLRSSLFDILQFKV
jgi:hypothetical protein